jgi:hypothetical protein
LLCGHHSFDSALSAGSALPVSLDAFFFARPPLAPLALFGFAGVSTLLNFVSPLS